MCAQTYIHPLHRSRSRLSAGQKGLSLTRLMKIGLPVPKTFYCDWNAYQRYRDGDNKLLYEIEKELQKIINPAKTYAIRSSANIEDSRDHSFAGQFDTVLNVQGVPAALEAIQTIWESAYTPDVDTYKEQQAITIDIKMAVLIQEMVEPQYSGVALSKNPVNGADEVIVEAITGEGSRLVQGGHTPDRWVNKWGFWIEKASNSPIPFPLIEQVVEQINLITAQVDFPVDTEWVYDGQTLYWVQLREITAMKTRNVYSNHLAREMMPGMIKPLSFYYGSNIMGSAMQSWLHEILGPLPIKTGEMVKSFYYHAYFNMGALGEVFKGFGFPAESMEMLLGVLPRGAAKKKLKPSLKTFSLLPSALVFFIKKIFFNKMPQKLDTLEEHIQNSMQENLHELAPMEILDRVDHHYSTVQELAYHTSLSLFLLMMINQALKRQLSRRGIEITNFDISDNMPELQAYYPSITLHELHQLYESMSPQLKQLITSSSYEELKEKKELQTFIQKFDAFLDRFGHLGDSGNDFSIAPWRETPDLVLKMVIDQQAPDKSETTKVRWEDLKGQGRISPLFKMCYKGAREFQYLRERSSCLYTRGKVMFRYYYLALARHLVQKQLLKAVEDIFYLTPAQIQQLVSDVGCAPEMRDLIENIKTDMECLQDVQIPSIIYGEDPPPVCEATASIMIGVPTSLGFYTGRVCVVKGEADFGKLQPGEVLVIPYSDVSWAPLFARAGALISESGGLLSHGSIVAREYNLPAIVSVEHATHLKDGTLVTVDAHQGILHILEDEDLPEDINFEEIREILSRERIKE